MKVMNKIEQKIKDLKDQLHFHQQMENKGMVSIILGRINKLEKKLNK